MCAAQQFHLVLDLDETLITTEASPNVQPDMCLADELAYHRPDLLRFLQLCFQHSASVSIWTAATESWLRAFLHSLPASIRASFAFTWSARMCEGVRKPLCKMWATPKAAAIGMGQANTFMLDDKPESCSDNVDNFVRVKPFYRYDARDRELLAVFARIYCAEPLRYDLGPRHQLESKPFSPLLIP
jgi:hypothetical protein